jgi:hypothetical protein
VEANELVLAKYNVDFSYEDAIAVNLKVPDEVAEEKNKGNGGKAKDKKDKPQESSQTEGRVSSPTAKTGSKDSKSSDSKNTNNKNGKGMKRIRETFARIDGKKTRKSSSETSDAEMDFLDESDEDESSSVMSLDDESSIDFDEVPTKRRTRGSVKAKKAASNSSSSGKESSGKDMDITNWTKDKECKWCLDKFSTYSSYVKHYKLHKGPLFIKLINNYILSCQYITRKVYLFFYNLQEPMNAGGASRRSIDSPDSSNIRNLAQNSTATPSSQLTE